MALAAGAEPLAISELYEFQQLLRNPNNATDDTKAKRIHELELGFLATVEKYRAFLPQSVLQKVDDIKAMREARDKKDALHRKEQEAQNRQEAQLSEAKRAALDQYHLAAMNYLAEKNYGQEKPLEQIDARTLNKIGYFKGRFAGGKKCLSRDLGGSCITRLTHFDPKIRYAKYQSRFYDWDASK